jgi:hypothetical protein
MKEPCLKKEAASSMKRPKETLCNSTDVRNPFLGFYFNHDNGLRRKLEHRCFLTFPQISQQHHLPIGKLQRIMMSVWIFLVDLPEDGCRVIDYVRFPEQAAWPTTYRSGKCKFRSWLNTDCRVRVFRRGKTACASKEIASSEFLANFGRT